jgi:Spy/CpxP family protein refolding chaperone
MIRHLRHPGFGARTSMVALCLIAAVTAPETLGAQQHQEHQEHARSGHTSDYADRPDSGIAALTPEEIEGLLAGEGMGMALPAELNGYPGPRHVLDMAEDLDLTEEQRGAVEAVFSEMHAAALASGETIVALERELDEEFSTGAITEGRLEELLWAIAEERTALRANHLRAHLRLVPILSPAQIQEYSRLRGYGS